MTRIDLDAVRELYASDSPRRRREIAAGFGSLSAVFDWFIATEDRLEPAPDDLEALFDRCTDPASSVATVAHALRALSPGQGGIGVRQVNRLVDLLRQRVGGNVRNWFGSLDLAPHIHAFGSGGDFVKTGHATTGAAITAAPRATMCKTGTTNVTSRHGSAEAAAALGCGANGLSEQAINHDLARFGFAFVPLAALGFAYGRTLSHCRRDLWQEASDRIAASVAYRNVSPAEALATTDIPLDIFKIVSPNAQLLNPRWHVTGVCHLSMIPYVLGIFLHLGTRGMILHSLDGIDELSNGHSLGSEAGPNNLVIEVTGQHLLISRFRPEDVDIASCGLGAIEEEPAAVHDVRNLLNVLNGSERGPKRDFIVLNAAVLLCEDRQNAAPFTDVLRDKIAVVEELIDSGESRDNLLGLLSALSERGVTGVQTVG